MIELKTKASNYFSKLEEYKLYTKEEIRKKNDLMNRPLGSFNGVLMIYQPLT